ncbi:hypothetical protein L3D22_03560 [Lysobacter soli]|uniref:hypothetical protein n=1 Tax=Lysobacter soli TaxID=453783 RepID=UPI00209DAB37|nr:hypothetical protein [Lysobacter soli]UTA54932.1 hypothetical protein L3D22_03560 [Lysobacter soli]
MRTIVRACVLAASIASIAACQRAPESARSEPAVAASTTPATNSTHATNTTSNAFDVEITLTPAARERLVSQHESLIASADYFGYPSARAQQQRVPGSENPWLTLHRKQVELQGAQLDGTPVAHFPAVSLDAKQLAWTDAPDAPQVNLNVYSGRRSSPDNLLDCTMFQDTLAVASRAPIRLACGLIGEAPR